MKTPVWFVEDCGRLYIRTLASSGKVKRIHNNATVNVAPCRMDGKPQGLWVPAQAQVVHDPEVDQKVAYLMDKKYGLLKKIFFRQGANQGQETITLEVKLI